MDIKNILKELTSAVGVSGKETDAVLTALAERNLRFAQLNIYFVAFF